MKEPEKEINVDQLTQQVGGRFRLTALIQKRMRQLVGQRVFGRHRSDSDLMDQVLREIEEGKIDLIARPPDKESQELP